MDAMKSCLSIVDNELEETCWVRGSPRKVHWLPSLTNEIYGTEKSAVMVPSAPNHEIPKTTSAPSIGSTKNGIVNLVSGVVSDIRSILKRIELNWPLPP
ncbi:hypothetical protein Tco_0424656 [Tanacetum coccineum]